jgi:hypothetical protein
LFHEWFEHALLVALSRRNQEGERLAIPFGAQMQFRAEAPAASAERLLFLPPFVRRTPAACWWARTTVPST